MKYFRNILSIILILVFGYILTGELVMPFNSPRNGNICEMLPGDKWYEVKEDGHREPFTVPGIAKGDITLETTLPEVFDRDYSVLCFRGMDMEYMLTESFANHLRPKTIRYSATGRRNAMSWLRYMKRMQGAALLLSTSTIPA